jgi:hypothetical protein
MKIQIKKHEVATSKNGHAKVAKIYKQDNTEKFRLVKYACEINGWKAREIEETLVYLVKKAESIPADKRKQNYVRVTFNNIVSELYTHYSKKDKDGVYIGARKTGVTPRGLYGEDNEYTAYELSCELIEKFIIETFGRGRTTCIWKDGISEPHEITLGNILSHNYPLIVKINLKDFGIKTARHVAGGEDNEESDYTVDYEYSNSDTTLENVAMLMAGMKEEKA